MTQETFQHVNASLTLIALTHTRSHSHTLPRNHTKWSSGGVLRLERHHVDATAAIVKMDHIIGLSHRLVSIVLNQPGNCTSKVMLSNGLPGVFAKTNVL